MKGSLALDEENSDVACFSNGSKLLLYSEDTVIYSNHEKFEKHYKHITLSDVNNAIQKYLIKQNMIVCILCAKIPEKYDIDDICKKIK